MCCGKFYKIYIGKCARKYIEKIPKSKKLFEVENFKAKLKYSK